MKKYSFFSAVLAVILLVCVAAPAHAVEIPDLTCGAAILVDGDHDEVLLEKNGYQRMYPASITKVMTALLVLEAVDRGELALDTAVSASEAAIAAITWDSSTQNIRPGEVLTVEELLYCALMASANESCNILAEAVGGTMANFASMMNRRAAELGMENTHYVNANGLHDPEHYTTAYDVYLVAREAMTHETFRTIVATASYEVPATNMSGKRTLHSSNLFISNYRIQGYLYPKAIGIKTGSTSAAGQCLASAAIDTDGRTFYCVVLGAQNAQDASGDMVRYSFKESKDLLEWGFTNFRRTVLLDQNSQLRELEVTLSDEQDHVLIQPSGSIERTLPKDYDPAETELKMDLPDSVEAPIAAGQKVGTVTVWYRGENYGTLELVAATDVNRSEVLYYLKVAKEYLEIWWVRAALISVVVLIVMLTIYCGVILPRRRRRYSRRNNRYSGRRRRY